MNDVLAIILGGGQGRRLFPLTHLRSKPAVPIGGKYRLIDVPVSNCLHAEIRRIFVLTQFNSASLNRHVSATYRLDPFSRGFVEIIAAEQTPDNPDWFQGTADAVRQALRHFIGYDAACYLILAGDHLYRMDYRELIEAHVARRADITIAVQPATEADATAMGIFSFSPDGQIVGFEEKPDASRLRQIGASAPGGAPTGSRDPTKPFIASVGIYVFSRRVLLDTLEQNPGHDFGREIIPAALTRYKVSTFLHDDYWADVGTVESFYEANIMLTRAGAPFNFHDPERPIFTHERFLPPARFRHTTIRDSLIGEGSFLEDCSIEQSVVGIRTHIGRGTRIRRSVLLGADFYRDAPFGIGRDVVLDRVIIDKNATIGEGARLINEKGIDEADGDGYYIRSGIVIVPKDGFIPPGTVV